MLYHRIICNIRFNHDFVCVFLFNETFYMNAINFFDVNVWLIILIFNFLIYNFYFNFVFICNFKIRIWLLKINRIFFKLITVFKWNLLNFYLNKSIVNENVISWRRNRVLKTSCSFSNVLQFSFVFVLYVNTFPSFTNLMKIVFLFIVRIFPINSRWRIDTILIKQIFLRNLCVYVVYFVFFFRNLLMIFVFLISFLFIELFNLKIFFSSNCEKIEFTKHDRKFLSRLYL